MLTTQSTCEKCVQTKANFLHANGILLKSVLLTRTEDPHSYTANVTIPEQPFYIEITGTSKNGTAFQRLQATQITPSQIRLNVTAGDSAAEKMSPGSEQTVSITVRNEGAAGFFEVTVTDTLGLVADYQPRNFTLDAHSSAPASIRLAVPRKTKVGQLSNLVFSVGLSGNTSSGNANFIRKTISVISDKTDSSPPTCLLERLTVDDNCFTAADCASSRWEADLKFTEVGSGIDGIFVASVGDGQVAWPLPDNYTSEGNATVSAHVSGTCCLLSATFTVVDRVGLTGACVVRLPGDNADALRRLAELKKQRPTTTQSPPKHGILEGIRDGIRDGIRKIFVGR